MITFTPLSGAARSTRTTPLAYILQVDDVRILLDCGSPDWAPEKQIDDEDAEQPWEEYCRALREYAPTVDLVLLSHGDLSHSGLYPYAYSRWQLKAPAYTTLPVQAMARIAATEDVDGLRDEEDVGDEGKVDFQDGDQLSTHVDESTDESPGPTTDIAPKQRYVTTSREVHDAFDSVNTLRYSQPTHLQGKCQGLTITPYNAGHTLGGTIWKIRSPSSGTIIYAVNMNHMRERHLDGTVLMRAAGGIFEPLARPDLLITDSDRASVITSRRKDRDAALLDAVTATLSSRYSLLLPCDSSTRVLELLVLLDQHWNYSRLRYPICFLSRTASEMLTFVRSMMEWLGGTVSKEDVGEEGTGGRHDNKRKRGDDDGDEDALGAFALRFKHLEFFPNPQALIQKYSSKDPKLILAVPASISHGPSRHLFCDFAATPDNVVLLTGRGEEGTLGRLLFDKWNDAQRTEDKWGEGKIGRNVMMEGVLSLKVNSKVPLAGADLEAHLQKEEDAKREADKKKAAQVREQPLLEADQGDSDSDSEDEDEVSRDLMEGDNDAFEGGRGNKNDTDWSMDDGLTRQLLSYDVYLKGNVAKATSFFKTLRGQAPRFRTFPHVEKKRRVDEYGEILDVSMWMQKGKILEEQSESDELKDYRKRQAEEDEKKAIQEPPSKFVTTEVEVQLACRLLFVDMEGLNDGRAVKTIVPKVEPRKLILVHGSSKDTDSLIESCANIRNMTKDIFAPTTLETVQIGQQINSFSISISDELLASMHMSRFEDNEVGYVTGRVVAHATSTVPTLETISIAAKPIAEETLDSGLDAASAASKPRILGSRPAVPLPRSTMIGELKLTALKRRLTDVGIQAELVGEGVLICGKRGAVNVFEQSVAVRKTRQGKVEMEGSVNEVYYIVRKEIYNLHALVAA